jgi:dTDP-alpha-D-glucose dehydrogenase
MTKNSKTISIIGFGYIGKVLASFFLEKKFNILAIEKNQKIIENYTINKKIDIEEKDVQQILNKNIEKITLKQSKEKFSLSKFIFITVGTPLVDNKPSMKMIFETLNIIKIKAPKNSILILKSTVIPGTTNKILKYLKDKNRADITLIYSPERLAEGSALKDLKNNPIILASNKVSKLNSIKKLFKKLKVKSILVSNYQTAEVIKLADNAWIDLNIALGNEIAKYCNKLKINSLEVIKNANTLAKGSSFVNILNPSIGVGGYCLPKDPLFLEQHAKKLNLNLKLPKLGRVINDNITNYSLEIILSFIRKLKISNPKIIIFGVSFKNNTGDCRNTPIKRLARLIKKNKINFEACDPLVSQKDFKQVTNLNHNLKLSKIDMQSYNVYIFGCSHDEFKKIYFPKTFKKKIIFDGRNLFKDRSIKDLKKKGYNYICL